MAKAADLPPSDVETRSFSKAETEARERRKAATRARIIDAACVAFLDEGYAISLEEIAQRAGVSRSSVFNQFENKRELFKIAMNLVCQQLFEELADVPEDLGLRETLLRYARIYVGKALSPEAIALTRISASGPGRSFDIGKLAYEAWRTPSVKLLGTFLGRQMDEGRIRRADPTKLAERFFAAATGQARNRMLFDVPGDPPDVIEADIADTVDLFVRGLLV